MPAGRLKGRTMSASERRPAGLRARGRRLWDFVTGIADLDEHERALLVEAARVLDDVERLERELSGEPSTVLGASGQLVVHPLRADLRAQRTLLARLLSQLDVPSEPDGSGSEWDGLSASARARRAARRRWDGRTGRR